MLAVGDSTRLEIIFSTGSYTSAMTKAPSIMTNEGEQPKHVRIKANVVKQPDSTFPIVIQPWAIEFGGVAGPKPAATLEFTITNKATVPLSPKIISAPNEFVSVSLPSVIPAFGSAVGSVHLLDEGFGEGFDKSVTIQLDDPEKTRFTIPVRRPGLTEV